MFSLYFHRPTVTASKFAISHDDDFSVVSTVQTLQMTVETILWTAIFCVKVDRMLWSCNLTPWSIVLQKLILTQLGKKLFAFHGTWISLPCSQEPTNCP